MTADTLLRIAYVANIVILVPVVLSLFASGSAKTVFGPGVPESPGLRLLVASLWGGILVCSIVGLFAPRVFLGIIVLQVVYKAAWLLAYVWPPWRAGRPVPRGPAATFVIIALAWPAILAATSL